MPFLRPTATATLIALSLIAPTAAGAAAGPPLGEWEVKPDPCRAHTLRLERANRAWIAADRAVERARDRKRPTKALRKRRAALARDARAAADASDACYRDLAQRGQ